MMRTTTAGALRQVTALGMALAVAVTSGCVLDWNVTPGGSEPREVSCGTADTCVCAAGESCNMSCSTQSCDIVCEENATCGITCSTASCTILCKAGSTCDLTCSGSQCETDCSAAESCVESCPFGASCSCQGCTEP